MNKIKTIGTLTGLKNKVLFSPLESDTFDFELIFNFLFLKSDYVTIHILMPLLLLFILNIFPYYFTKSLKKNFNNKYILRWFKLLDINRKFNLYLLLVITVLTKITSVKDVKLAIDYNLILIIGLGLALGKAMENSGC